MDKLYMSTKQVSEMTGISEATLRRDRMLGVGLPFYKIGKTVRYSIDDITAYMDANRVETERRA